MGPAEYARRLAEIRDRLQADVNALLREGGNPFADAASVVEAMQAARAADAIAEIGALLRDRIEPTRRGHTTLQRVRKALGYTRP